MDLLKKLIKALFLFFENKAKEEAATEFEAAEQKVELEQQVKHEEHKVEAAKATDAELDSSNDDMLARLRRSGH